VTVAEVSSGHFAALPNGTRLHYASAGKPGAPLMIFLHGFPEFWLAWKEQLAEFGADFYAVAPDLRGFNLSSQPPGVEYYRPKLIVEDVRLLIAHLGYPRAVLVVHDWGGAIGWNVAIFQPQIVERLIVINAPHPYQFMRELAQSEAQRAASAYMNWLRVPGSEKALVKDDFRLLDGIFTGNGQGGAAWFDAPTRALYHACWGRPGDDGAPAMQGAVNYYRASPLHPPEPGTSIPFNAHPRDWTVSVPTRVIWGERDVALRTGLLDGLDQVCTDLRVTRVADGSHWIIHEQPARVNALIRDALVR
jgi:pimeloyl-ACP methyl ester carboxylesterase